MLDEMGKSGDGIQMRENRNGQAGEVSAKYEMVLETPSAQDDNQSPNIFGLHHTGHRPPVARGASSRSKNFEDLPVDHRAMNANNTDRKITLNDVKQILPTCLILIFTVVILLTIIPYAFSTVIKQMQLVDELEVWRREQEEMEAAVNKTGLDPAPDSSTEELFLGVQED